MKKLVKTLLYVLAITIIMSFSVHIIIADEEADYYSAFNVLVENKNQDNFSSQIKAFINTYGDYISNDEHQINILTSCACETK